MSLIYYLLVVVFAKPFQLLGSVSFDGFHRSLQSLCLRGKLVFATTTKKATTVAKNIERKLYCHCHLGSDQNFIIDLISYQINFSSTYL